MDTEELEHYLLELNESDVDIRYLALQHEDTFSLKGTSDFLLASVARWDEHERTFVIHEQKCQDFCGAKDYAKRSARRISKADFFFRNQELRGKTL